MTLSGFSLLCMHALEQRIERRIERPLVKNVGGAALEFAGCAPLWFLELRVLPPDGLRGAFKIARDGLHLTALRILHSSPRVFRTASGDKRRSTELRGATPNARQNFTKPRPKVFGTARGDL